jgi:PAT family beta-lactamase induction signal transducer AmpG
LEQEYGDKQKAWSYTMMSGSSWQYWRSTITFYAKNGTKNYQQTNRIRPKSELWGCFQFFQKKQIGLALAFILLFRLGESQLLKMLTLLIDNEGVGGMGLTTGCRVIYGTFGVISLTMVES